MEKKFFANFNKKCCISVTPMLNYNCPKGQRRKLMKKETIIYLIKGDVESYYKFASPKFKEKAVDMLWKEFERRREWKRNKVKAYKNLADREILSQILLEFSNTRHLFAYMVEKELGLL